MATIGAFTSKRHGTKVARLHGWDSAGMRLADARSPKTLEVTPIGWSGAEGPRARPGG
ncbi:hypothetical protein LRS10_20260 [Phenylobacterium sp. J426]|uniref:hypothetical protein n=1 Tax=Phenylobacterium sp. J426 TaxID=2898439 RepID=UPI002150F9D3|nr:hypothetical protein [Phenylobacterium sp. J426]MCR5876276.1 hypothetical protein [Phenylobacterium sp. J426]